MPVTSGGYLRLARARTPAGTPADGVPLPIPQQPFVFAGLPSALCGACDDVVLPPTGQHDWELELAVVIRRHARHVAERVPESRLGGRRAA